jgi:hypothetical protein
MKRTSAIFLTAIFFSVLAVFPLRAQTNVAAESITTNAVAPAPIPPSYKTPEGSGYETGIPGLGEIRKIVVSLAPFVMVVAIIVVVGYFRHRRHQMMNETLRSMIEKGMPITPDLVDSLKTKGSVLFGNGNRRNDLRRGLILIGVGIGVVVLAGKPGWIIFFIGVAFLVVWFFEKNNSDNNQPPQPPKI